VNEENENSRQRRRALLLHLAGTDVQDIFYTLPDTGDATDYKKAVDVLNAYLVPKVDTTSAKRCFRQLTQAPGETNRQFATRLRRTAKDCDYGQSIKSFASALVRKSSENSWKNGKVLN